ncbi:MAG: ATP-binding protein [Bacteroidota bacterium]
MDEKEVQSFLIIFSIIAFFLALTVVLLFAIFQKRKNKLLREQEAAENRFREEIIEAEVEIREETLRNISWELHDNIGQMLTLAKIQLQNSEDTSGPIQEAEETIGSCLIELRSLSKLINPDTFKTLTLVEALKLEVERFNRMKYLEASLDFNEETFDLDKKVEVVIFRMLQEFFTNTVKHSKASKLTVHVHYNGSKLNIEAQDNGVGFDSSNMETFTGIGLSNIRNRAKLIKAQAEIVSRKGKGTQFYLTYINS